MHRTEPPATLDRPAVRAARSAAQHPLLPAGRRDGHEPGADETDRRAVPRNAILWQPQDGRGTGHQSQTCAAADAADGFGGRGRETAHHAAGPGAQDLPLFTAESGDHAAQSSVGHRHHLHSAAAGLLVPGGGDGLVQPLRVGVALVEHFGGTVLFGSSRRGAGQAADRRYSTATRDRNSRPRPSPADCKSAAWRSRWMAAAGH